MRLLSILARHIVKCVCNNKLAFPVEQLTTEERINLSKSQCRVQRLIRFMGVEYEISVHIIKRENMCGGDEQVIVLPY